MTAQAALEQAARWRDRAREREDITLAGLDLMAGQRMPRDRPGWDDEDVPDDDDPGDGADRHGSDDDAYYDDLFDEPGARSSGAATGGANAEGTQARAPGTGRRDAGAASRATTEPRGQVRTGWMGPPDGGPFAMPMPRAYKWIILAALILVEVPIYYDIFLHLHGSADFLTWGYTLPVALGMVMAPHLAGRLFRNRHLMPIERIVPWLVGATMLLWAGGAGMLGWLRQQVLLTPRIDPETGGDVGGVTRLGMQHGHLAMTIVFAIILLLSGLIAFMLGMAEEHPAVIAYRAAVRVRERAEALFLEATSRRAQTVESTLVPEDEQLANHWREVRAREQAIVQEHLAAESAYLDAVALGIGQPTITQAICASIAGEPPGDRSPDERPGAGDDRSGGGLGPSGPGEGNGLPGHGPVV
jgi:hypothetical protein